MLPDGADRGEAAARPRRAAWSRSAKLSADDTRLEDVKDLLNAEGTGGRVIQAPDGTLLVTSTIPAGLGINSEDWPQPQQLDSLMGKVLRINADGIDSEGQPVRRPGRRASGDLRARHPRRSGHRDPSADRHAVDERARPARRRRDQRDREGQELRLPGHRLRPRLHRQADQRRQDRAGGHGAAGLFLDARHRAGAASAFYTGKHVSGVAGQPVRVGARRASISCASSSKATASSAEERLLTELNTRIRGVNEGPDGALYVLTDGNGGKILRLVKK